MKLYKANIMYFFLLLPFFEPKYINVEFRSISTIFNILQIISFLIITLMYFKTKNKSKMPIYIFIFQLIILLSTFLNNGDMRSCISATINIMGLIMITDHGINNNTKSFLSSILFIFEILILINLITIFAFPNGMYINATSRTTENWFLGYDNSHIFIIMPALITSIVYSLFIKNKIIFRTVFLFIISIITIFTRWPATGVTVMIIFIMYIIFSKLINKSKILNIKTYITISIVSFFSIIVFRLQNLFSFFIVDFLKKDLTFTGRTYIWDYVLEFIKAKPLLGYGIENKLVRYYKTTHHRSFHAHNQFLEMAYQGGIVLVVAFIFIIFKTSKELYKYKTTKMSNVLSFCLFLYLILMLTEVCDLIYLFFIIVISFNINKLIIFNKESGC